MSKVFLVSSTYGAPHFEQLIKYTQFLVCTSPQALVLKTLLLALLQPGFWLIKIPVTSGFWGHQGPDLGLDQIILQFLIFSECRNYPVVC